jgi:hypothetical protein
MTKPRRIKAKSFRFDNSTAVVKTGFTISRRKYLVQSNDRGYSIATGSEFVSYQYKKGVCQITLTDGKDTAKIKYDFSRFPEVRVNARGISAKNTWSAIGDGHEVLSKGLQTNIVYPKIPGIRSLLQQFMLSKDFSYRYRKTIAPAIPFEDYYPYFAMNPSCTFWCSACLTAIFGSPGMPLDDILACTICAACAIRNGV